MKYFLGSGCGSAARAVASDTRGLRFKSSHQQKFKKNNCQLNVETKKGEKSPGMAHFTKQKQYVKSLIKIYLAVIWKSTVTR